METWLICFCFSQFERPDRRIPNSYSLTFELSWNCCLYQLNCPDWHLLKCSSVTSPSSRNFIVFNYVISESFLQLTDPREGDFFTRSHTTQVKRPVSYFNFSWIILNDFRLWLKQLILAFISYHIKLLTFVWLHRDVHIPSFFDSTINWNNIKQL